MEKFTFSLVFLNILTLQASELPTWHLKPFGSHLEPKKVDESFADNLISAKEFAEKYVLPRKPIVLRGVVKQWPCLLYTSPSPRDKRQSRMPSSA